MPDSGRLTIVAGLLARALDVGVRCGLDRQQLLAELGVDAAVLEDRDNRLPVETFARLWNIISARCPGRPLALDWIATFKITDAGLMGYLVSHLKTVREAAQTMARFGYVVNQAAAPELVEGPAASRIRYLLSPTLLATEHAPESILVSLTAFLRGVAGQDFVPLLARMPYPATARTPALQKFFGSPINHDAGELSLEFATEVLDRPLP